jgi:hypothetical protein
MSSKRRNTRLLLQEQSTSVPSQLSLTVKPHPSRMRASSLLWPSNQDRGNKAWIAE